MAVFGGGRRGGPRPSRRCRLHRRGVRGRDGASSRGHPRPTRASGTASFRHRRRGRICRHPGTTSCRRPGPAWPTGSWWSGQSPPAPPPWPEHWPITTGSPSCPSSGGPTRRPSWPMPGGRSSGGPEPGPPWRSGLDQCGVHPDRLPSDRGHRAGRHRAPAVIADTDALATSVWHDRYVGGPHQPALDLADPDSARPLPAHHAGRCPLRRRRTARRRARPSGMTRAFEAALDCGVPWSPVSGDRVARLAQSIHLSTTSWPAPLPIPRSARAGRMTSRRPWSVPIVPPSGLHRLTFPRKAEPTNDHRPTDDNVRRDRAVGAVLASAAGDALGAPHEFGPALDPATSLAMTGGGPFRWAPGEWTDDTQTALTILEPLSRGLGARCHADEVARGLLAWFESRPPDVGIRPARSCRSHQVGTAPCRSHCGMAGQSSRLFRQRESDAHRSVGPAASPGLSRETLAELARTWRL